MMGDAHGPEPGHWGNQQCNFCPGVRTTIAIFSKCQQTMYSSIRELQKPVVLVNDHSSSSKENKTMFLAAFATHSGNRESRKHLPPLQPKFSANWSPDVNGFSPLPLLSLFLTSLFRHHSIPLGTKCAIKVYVLCNVSQLFSFLPWVERQQKDKSWFEERMWSCFSYSTQGWWQQTPLSGLSQSHCYQAWPSFKAEASHSPLWRTVWMVSSTGISHSENKQMPTDACLQQLQVKQREDSIFKFPGTGPEIPKDLNCSRGLRSEDPELNVSSSKDDLTGKNGPCHKAGTVLIQASWPGALTVTSKSSSGLKYDI